MPPGVTPDVGPCRPPDGGRAAQVIDAIYAGAALLNGVAGEVVPDEAAPGDLHRRVRGRQREDKTAGKATVADREPAFHLATNDASVGFVHGRLRVNGRGAEHDGGGEHGDGRSLSRDSVNLDKTYAVVNDRAGPPGSRITLRPKGGGKPDSNRVDSDRHGRRLTIG